MLKGIFGFCDLFVKPLRQLGELFMGTWWVWAAIIIFSALITFVTLAIVKFLFGII